MDHVAIISKWLGDLSPDQTPISQVALLDIHGEVVAMSENRDALYVGIHDRFQVTLNPEHKVAPETEAEKKDRLKLAEINRRQRESVARQKTESKSTGKYHDDLDKESADTAKKMEDDRHDAVKNAGKSDAQGQGNTTSQGTDASVTGATLDHRQ